VVTANELATTTVAKKTSLYLRKNITELDSNLGLPLIANAILSAATNEVSAAEKIATKIREMIMMKIITICLNIQKNMMLNIDG
jgi:aromatic ring hydroxylase